MTARRTPARDAEAARYRALAALSAEHPGDYGRLLAEHGGRPGEAHEALARLHPARLEALLVVELAAAPPRGPAPRRRTLVPCGTPGAYQRHRVNDEETDVACRLAMAAVAVARHASDDTARARRNADERCRTRARAALAANHRQEYRTLLAGRDGTNATNAARAELARRYPREFQALLVAAREHLDEELEQGPRRDRAGTAPEPAPCGTHGDGRSDR
jgi:hypothetical protein